MTKIKDLPTLEVKTEDYICLTTEGTFVSNFNEPMCEMHINEWFAISVPRNRKPNKFHRFMQKLFFGFTYKDK